MERFSRAPAPPPRFLKSLRNLTGVMRNLKGMALKEPKALEGTERFRGVWAVWAARRALPCSPLSGARLKGEAG